MSLKNNSARLLLVLLLAALSLAVVWPAGAGAQGESFGGYWEMEAARGGDNLSVMLGRRTESGGRDNRYFKLSLDELSGLTRAQVFAKGEPVSFQLRRPAGTFDLKGRFSEGRGEGTFTFSPDRAYVETMRRDGYGDAVTQNLFGFAIGNFDGSLSGQFAALGVERPTPAQLGSMSQFGVSVGFIRELKALGYEPRSIEQLIDLRKHGASVEFIKALLARGYERPTLDQLISMRQQAVSFEFIDELRALGYDPRSVEQLTSLRQQGAGIPFIKGLLERGYEPPTLDQLISMRQQGVTHAFIDELKSLGYERVPVEQLTDLRRQGVTIDAVRKLKAEGHGDAPLEYLIDVRMFGMPVELISRLPRRAELDEAAGEWRVKFYRRGTERVWAYLRDRTGRLPNSSFELSPAQLAGLDEAQAFSADGARVRFTLPRGGATLVCTGWFKDGFGAGVFTFAPETK